MSSHKVTRRKFIGNSTFMALGLPVVLGRAYPAFAAAPTRAGHILPPKSPRSRLNFNLDWRFIREDVAGAEAPAFDDSQWTTVSTRTASTMWTRSGRSSRTAAATWARTKGSPGIASTSSCRQATPDRKIFLEFEGMRQAGDIFLNGKQVGLYENGITAYGSRHHRRGAFRARRERAGREGGQHRPLPGTRLLHGQPKNADGTPCVRQYEWNANDFNPDHGGINRHVWLHVTGKIHQTLPLYYGLETRAFTSTPATSNLQEDGRT